MEPMNLLVIMSDEHNPKMAGYAGHPVVRTPNLNALAARGTRFSSAYTNSPICVPARASFATGQYVHAVRYWDNALAYDGRVPGWAHRLRDAGSRVESIGKLHYRTETDDTGFIRQHIPLHIEDGVGMVFGSVRDPMPEEPPWRRNGQKPGGMVTNAGPGETSYIRYDRKVAELACAWLADAGRDMTAGPWTLFVSFVAPHYPLIVPEEYFGLYAGQALPPPNLDPADGYERHPWVNILGTRQPHGIGCTQEAVQRALAAYFGLCTFLDDNVGRVLSALDDAGLAERTRIVYASDHGENAGARGLWGKGVFYEESAGIPLIVAGHDVPAGHTCATPVSLIDGYPAILQAAGLDPHIEQAGIPGRSWFDIARSEDDPERIAFSEYHAIGSPSAGYMLRKGRYKLNYYVGFRPELFDLVADPEEAHDLARHPGHAAALADCERALRRIVDPEATDRRAKDDQNAMIERHGGREAVLGTRYGSAGFTRIPEELQSRL